MDTSPIQQTPTLQNAISAVEALSLEEQTLLIEIIQKKLQQQKRNELEQEIESVRQEYKEGKVIFGSVADFMNDLEEVG
jgi:ribosomal protein L18E